ncbi:MAG: GreA/GreB family elongation factor [Thermomicrobiales bacterium]|nr:GreA/GreB family elongation factor [Thermomicrobiales bacterium]
MAELKQTLLTVEGKRELEAMLPTLVAQKREVKERLQSAKTYGDAADGGEIGEAKDELLRLDRRINEIEYTLSHAKVVDAAARDGTVRIGSQVTIVDDTGETETWTIVEPAEASTRNRKISDQSPMGAAMFGKRAGDEIRVRAPGGDLVYRIVIVE